MTDHPAPLPRSVVRGLRREAFRQLQSDPRRTAFPAVLHVGRLDAWPAEQDACEVPRAVGPGWARDVVEAMLLDRRRAEVTDAWLTRPGDPEPDHLDRVWAAALREAAAAYALPPARFFVVTRTGWTQVLTEPAAAPAQRWTRLRLVLPAA